MTESRVNAFGPVEISGKIESHYYNSRGTKLNTGSTSFMVITDGTGWQIITSQTGSAPFSIASDGKSTHTLISALGSSAGKIGDAAEIDSVSIPLATSSELIPWYFFVLNKGAEALFREQPLPLPWTVPRNDSQAYFCDQKITWSDSEPLLMDKVEFYFSESRVLAASTSPYLDRSSPPVISREIAKTLAPSAFAAGMAGECAVTEWTNTLFGMYPLQFKVNVYNALLDYHANRTPATIRIRFEGLVTEIRKAVSISYTPPLRGPIWTRDYRFRDASKGIEAVRYGPSKTWLTNKSEVDLSRAEIVRSAPLQRF